MLMDSTNNSSSIRKRGGIEIKARELVKTCLRDVDNIDKYTHSEDTGMHNI